MIESSGRASRRKGGRTWGAFLMVIIAGEGIASEPSNEKGGTGGGLFLENPRIPFRIGWGSCFTIPAPTLFVYVDGNPFGLWVCVLFFHKKDARLRNAFCRMWGRFNP